MIVLALKSLGVLREPIGRVLLLSSAMYRPLSVVAEAEATAKTILFLSGLKVGLTAPDKLIGSRIGADLNRWASV